MKTILERTAHSIATPPEQIVRHTAHVFLCPSCESPLEYERTHWRDPAIPADLTDDYRCPVGCGTFEYERKRHRLRHTESDPFS